MKFFIKNSIANRIARLLRAKLLEFKYREKSLKIGYMSVVNKCKFGNYNTIYDYVFLDEVELGDFTYIASGTRISKTKIGKFCSIGPDCKIGLGKHPSKDFVSTHPVFFSTLKQSQISFADMNYFKEFENIVIGNDVWIGANAIIVDGVTIGDGVIVAAGSVVTEDIAPYAIVGGVPAKVIRYRFKEEEIEMLLKIKWWEMDIDFLKNNFKMFHSIEFFKKGNWWTHIDHP